MITRSIMIREARKQTGSFRRGRVNADPHRRARRFNLRAALTPLLPLVLVVFFTLGNPTEMLAQTTPGQTTEKGQKGEDNGGRGRDGKPGSKRARSAKRRGGGSSGTTAKFPDIYRVRLFLVDEEGATVDEADISSSLGGESMQVKNGGMYVIPAATVPQDRWLTIIAEKKSAFIQGTTRAQLMSDPNPSLTIKLINPRSASISGIVLDEAGISIEGAKVSVVGHPGEETTTDSQGNFKLPAHAAKNQMVQLQVGKSGFEPQPPVWHMAGDQPVQISLKRIKP